MIRTRMTLCSSTRHLPLQHPISKTTTSPNLITTTKTTNSNPNSSPIITNFLSLSLALSLTLSTPLSSLAIPSLNSPSKPPFLSPTTPFSQAKNLPLGLENGKIRTCPSINPSCISTNPKSSNFEFPWQIPSEFTGNAVQKLQDAILNTQKNAEIQAVEDAPNGKYIRAEFDGGFGRDILEVLVKGDVVSYRCMAKKVTYVYPFTTAFGDTKGQQERMKKILEQLDWYVPNLDLMD